MDTYQKPAPTSEAIAEENRRMRRLRLVVQLALEVIAQGEVVVIDECCRDEGAP